MLITSLFAFVLAAIASPGLPDGYERVDYVESTGAQYIDTGVSPDRTTVVTFDWQSCKGSGVTFQVPLGTKNADSTAKQMGVLIGTPNSLQCSVLCTTWTSPTVIWDIGARHVVVLDASANAIYLDGEKQTDTTPVVDSLPSIYLFARHSPSAGAESFAQGRCYGCEISKGGQLERQYVPAYERSTGRCGLFDVLHSQFAPNEGTGADFKQTPLAVPQSDVEYCEYLESDGTGYIDTGVFPSVHTRALVDWLSYKKEGESFQSPFGVKRYANDFGFGFVIYSNNALASGVLSLFQTSGYSWTEGDRHAIGLDASSGELNVDFRKVDTVQTNELDYGSVYLFARNGDTQPEAYAKGRLYGCKIFSEDVLVKEFVPARHKSGLLGLYERIGRKFYFNPSVQGAFKVGNAWVYGYKKVEYVETHGVEYVDTAVIPTLGTDVELKWMSLKELGTTFQVLFGSHVVESALNRIYGSYIGSANTCVGVLGGDSKTAEGVVWNKGDCKTLALNGSTRNLCIDGEVKAADIAAKKLPAESAYLFARNHNGAVNHSVGRFYAAKIRQSGRLVRDFIPVVRRADGKAMLYDKVWGGYFENKGEGEFSAPPPRGLMFILK